MGDQALFDELVAQYADHDFLEFKIQMDDATDNLSGITARIFEWKRKYNIDFAIIDHIGLIALSHSDAKMNRNDMMGKVSRSLKKLCKQLEMPIIALSQLNRHSEKENRAPRLSDLRDSGCIEQDADVVMFLHNADQQLLPQRDIQIGLLKNRNGVVGWLPERFQFDGSTQRFTQIGTMG